jgi:WhiB family redox-sensing transcriptional regulator
MRVYVRLISSSQCRERVPRFISNPILSGRSGLSAVNRRIAPKEYHMDWRDKAACLTADPELFFPVGNTGPAVDQIDKAKAVCARCSVTEMCLQYALDTSQDSGVWGGLSEDERRALKRRAARARRAS